MNKKEKNGLPEMYKYYRAKFKMYQKVHEYNIFKGVLRDFNQEITRLMVEHGAEYKMPVRLGSIRIKKYKRAIRLNEDGSVNKNGMGVNWPESKSLWAREYPGLTPEELKKIRNKPLVYYLNEHTDGYRFILYWNKNGSNAKNRRLYSFVFTSVNNRYLGAILRSNKKPEYYE